MALTVDVGGTGLALGIQAVERQLQALLGGLPGVNRAPDLGLRAVPAHRSPLVLRNRAVPPDVLARIDGILKHHGHAGPMFVRRLVEHRYHARPDDLRQTILNAARLIAGKDADSMRIRAATVFALLLIAGGLAKEFELLPHTTDVEGAVKWGWQQFDQSSDALALKPEQQIIGKRRAAATCARAA